MTLKRPPKRADLLTSLSPDLIIVQLVQLGSWITLMAVWLLDSTI